MFERFTDRARRVVVLAQEEARLLGHDYIGTEHLLLGLAAEDEGVAAKALEGLGIGLDMARAAVEDVVGRGALVPSGHIPFTPKAKRALESSLREALELGHNHIGTEHILLGLVRCGYKDGGAAARVIAKLGIDLEVVRQRVQSLLVTPAPAAVGPACARCGAALTGGITTTEVQVPGDDDAAPLAVLFARCAGCGAVVGLLSGGG